MVNGPPSMEYNGCFSVLENLFVSEIAMGPPSRRSLGIWGAVSLQTVDGIAEDILDPGSGRVLYYTSTSSVSSEEINPSRYKLRR